MFIYASRSNFPNGSKNVEILGPLYGGTGVPSFVPVVVLGEGTGSY